MASDPKSTSRIGRFVGRLIKQTVGLDVVAQNVVIDTPTPNKTSSNDTTLRANLQKRIQQYSQWFDWSVEMSRKKKYQDYRIMDTEVPELAQATNVQVSFTFGGETDAGDYDALPVTIEYSDSARPEIKKIVDEAMAVLKPSESGPRTLYEALSMGDTFSELIWSRGEKGTARLVGQKELNPESVRIIQGADGKVSRFLVASPEEDASQNGVSFAPWEIAHFSYNRKWNHKYGASQWESARKLWGREQATLDVLSLLTLMRAAARKSVAYPVPNMNSPDDIEKWREQLSDGNWHDSIFGTDGELVRKVVSRIELDDIIYPFRQGTVAPTFHDEPAADLNQLLLVLKYYQERYFVVTGTPAGLAAMERNVNARSTLEQQGLYFVRKIKSFQREYAQYLTRILHLACVVGGYPAEDGEFSVRMPRVASFDAETRAKANKVNAETAALLLQQGWDEKHIAVNINGVPADKVDDILVRDPILNTAPAPTPDKPDEPEPDDE